MNLFATIGDATRPDFKKGNSLTGEPPDFKGSDYVPELDRVRLTGQLLRVFEYMSNGKWRTLREIGDAINEPEASISAQLRNLKKDGMNKQNVNYGGHEVPKRRRGNKKSGLWEYKLIINESSNGFTP